VPERASHRIDARVDRVGPLTFDESLAMPVTCQACGDDFMEGEFFALIPIGPGSDPYARAAARGNSHYEPMTVPIHWICLTGDE
jgi:hypothetical protein